MQYKVLTVLLFFNQALFAQNNQYPQDFFRSPIDGRIYLSGTFAELRSNHFHAGIDIKTGGEIGKNIYAIADGYVSRIKVSPYGYGHAVYIAHPNGFTSVYGHLNEILGPYGVYVKQQQYSKQKFALDLYFQVDQFPVNKGDTIAISGNTGSSGGPHLHFEIRETATQEPINPLLFGYQIKDHITPKIRGLRIYPAEKKTLINGENQAVGFSLRGWGKEYKLLNSDTISISGDFYTAINTIDKQNDSENRNGVYQIELWIDSTLFYMHNMERINFSTSRYLNTLIDFDHYKKNNSRFQRTFISPNNLLKIYKVSNNSGVISFNDSTYHELRYVIKDLSGNESVLKFTVYFKRDNYVQSPIEPLPELFLPLVENRYEDSLIRIDFPIRSLYDTLSFTCSIDSSFASINGLAYNISRVGIGLQKRLFVRLKDINIKPEMIENVFVGELYEEKIYPYAAEWDEGDLTFKTRDFGTYLIRIDSIPPKLRLLTKRLPNNSQRFAIIDFHVDDEDSGIAQYDAWYNGSWVLLKWDPKENHMYCEVDLKEKDENKLKVRLTDRVGNVTEKDFDF